MEPTGPPRTAPRPMKAHEVLQAFSPPKATTASQILIIVIVAVAVLGTIPNLLGATIIGAPAIGFFAFSSLLGILHTKLSKCFGAGQAAAQCTQTEMLLSVLGYGLLLPSLVVYCTQLGVNYFAAHFACQSKLHIGTMAAGAAIPGGAMAFLALVVLGLSIKPIILGGKLSPVVATIADPLFVFGYLLACSAASTLMVLQASCATPTVVQEKIVSESLGGLNKPAAPTVQYHHA